MRDIMLVEDEALVLLDLTLTIEQLGYRVHSECVSVDEGLSELARSTPDAALLDIDVGGSLVWPLARALSERGCPVVFVSANCTHRELDTEFRHARAIEKPASGDDIDAALRIVFGDPNYGTAASCTGNMSLRA